MKPTNVVLYQNDARTAQVLATNLSRYFPSVYTAKNSDEVRSAIARYRAEVVVLDVEASGPSAVESLHEEFPSVSIVCTHRLADEKLRAAALQKGAADMCVPWNSDEVIRSVIRDRARRAAA